MPAVSVLLPVYNGARFLRPALESILGQSFTDFELLVLDDGSTDDSVRIAEGYRDPRIRILSAASNQGLPRALNRGLAAASGEFVARQDADDLSHPDRFARQLEFLRANPTVALVGAQAEVIDETGAAAGRRLAYPCDDAAIRRRLLLRNPFAHTTVMFRRTAVLAVGGYDESFRYCQDFALWNRLATRHRVANLHEVLAGYRIHSHDRMSDRLKWRRLIENARIIGRNLLPLSMPARY
jgi:glycosyltransferase involved in cell wall biosynthesis